MNHCTSVPLEPFAETIGVKAKVALELISARMHNGALVHDIQLFSALVN